MNNDLKAGGVTETVCLNVGGQIYQVSRSLLEQHADTMLARMIDKYWQKEAEADNAVLFIDRSGHRFQYVLDFMRDGQVFLPVTVSKFAFLLDLEYYGFDAEQDAISSTTGSAPPSKGIHQGNLAEVSQILATVEGNIEADLKALDETIGRHNKEIKQCERKKAALKTAHALFLRISRSSDGIICGGKKKCETVRLKRSEYGSEDSKIFDDATDALKDKDYLDSCLSVYGLDLVSANTNGCSDCTIVLKTRLSE